LLGQSWQFYPTVFDVSRQPISNSKLEKRWWKA